MPHDEAVDLRSDTVTRPTAAMRRAMATAEVGDDVYREDPTVRHLEELAAARVGHEAALFVPTGTMGNEIAIQLHAAPGSEAIVEASSHVYNYELAAMAAWAGVLPRVLRGERGHLDPEQVREVGSPRPYYEAPVRLLVVENTHNHAGGTVLPEAARSGLIEAARASGIACHLDGARIFNAAIASGREAKDLAAGFDTVMFCFSKGLGAPVGSVLCGSAEAIEEARVLRKRLGGGMRQAGILAAAAIHALEQHVERLAEDHRRARRLAEALAGSPRFRLDPDSVETNIVIANAAPADSRDELIAALRERGVLAGGMGPGRVRFVTHLDVDDEGLSRAIQAIRSIG